MCAVNGLGRGKYIAEWHRLPDRLLYHERFPFATHSLPMSHAIRVPNRIRAIAANP